MSAFPKTRNLFIFASYEHDIHHTSGCRSQLHSAHDRIRVRHIHYDRTPLPDAVVCRGCHPFGAAFPDFRHRGDDPVSEVCDMEATSSHDSRLRYFFYDCNPDAPQDRGSYDESNPWMRAYIP